MDRVTFTGRLSDAHLVDHLARCRAVCFPPFEEDYGFVTAEAFASRKAVITCRDSGGPAELVDDGVSGFISEPTPHALSVSLRRVMDDAGLAERMGEAAAVRGAKLNWAAVQGPGVRHSLALPTYPFQRQRFLIPFKTASRRAAGPSVHELLGTRLGVAGVAAQFERVVSATDPAWVGDHRIAGEVVMPLTAYLEAALSAARQVDATVTGLDAVEVGEPMPLREGESRVLQVSVDRAAPGAPARVRVFSRDAAREDAEWALHASALASHAVKMGSRLALNSSPEPVSNIAASVAEDAAVLGVVWFAIEHPVAAASIAAVLLVAGLAMLYVLVRVVRRGVRRWRQRRDGPPAYA